MQKQIPPTPIPAHQVFTDAQWRTIAAIADAVLPSIKTSKSRKDANIQVISSGDYEAAKKALRQSNKSDQTQLTLEDAYLAENASTIPGFKEGVIRFIANYTDQDNTNSLLFILSALDTRPGSLLLTGRITPIADLTLEDRQAVLREWRDAYIPIFRFLYRAFTMLTELTWIRTSPLLGQMLTYPKTPINHSFGPGFPFEFIQIPPAPKDSSPPEEEVLETDFVVVGSGCTGGVVASVLASAGLAVVVADRAYYWPPEYLPMSESHATTHLFHNGGITQADDGLFNIVSGSCWGGGGTVNWSASLQLQHSIRQEWARLSGLPQFTSAAFQTDLDAVCERMGAGTSQIQHNFTNRTLMEGARKLGMAAKAVPQNTAGEAHNCGYCTLGCGSCGKKGPTETWLPDAARSGAKFVEGFAATKVLFDTTSSPPRATGVLGTWTSRGADSFPLSPGSYKRTVRINARKGVISASGALGTPVLLKNSGITNPHVGSHLHLHPVSVVGGVFDTATKPWDGGILTSVVTDLENQDGAHHGVKLEAITMIPGMYLPTFSWRDPLEGKLFAAKMSHSVGYISLARDSSEGKVYVDPKDPLRPRVQYVVNFKDRQHIARGIEALAKILYVQGAREIRANVPGIPDFVRARTEDAAFASPENSTAEEEEGINDPAFQHWLTTYIHPLIVYGHPKRDTLWASAHQMGSARLGSSEKTSATDGQGRVWGRDGLYVADTCLFPAASGVNPMVTGMAVARGVARGIVRREKGEEGRPKL